MKKLIKKREKKLLQNWGFIIKRDLCSPFGLRHNGNPFDGGFVSFDYEDHHFDFLLSNNKDEIESCLFKGEPYESQEIELIRKYFPLNGVFVDVGANIGNHAVFVSKLCSASRIIAMEPNPFANRLLRINLLLNGLMDKAVVHSVGLSNRNGEGYLTLGEHKQLGQTRVEATGDGAPVMLVTGDDLLVGQQVDFIKIDVEEHELAVLDGLRSVFGKQRPIAFVEVAAENQAAFLNLINEFGYKVAEEYQRYQGLKNFLIIPR